MRWLRHAFSLRARITASFTLIVVGGTVVSTLIGSRIITNALLDQARTRGRQGLEAARTIYDDQLGDLRDNLQRAANSGDLQRALRSQSPQEIGVALGATRDRGPSFVVYMDGRTGQGVYAGGATPAAVAPSPG